MADAVVRLVQPSGDDTGATDPDNIAAMVSTLQTAYSSRAFVTIVLAGQYYFDEAVAITGTPGVVIQGVDARITQKTAATACFAFSSSSYCGVKGIRFYADSDTVDAITFDGVTHSETDNNWYEAKHTGRGVSADGTCTRTYFHDAYDDAELMRKMVWKTAAADPRTTYCHSLYSYNASAISAGATEYDYITAYYFFEPSNGSYDYSRVHPGYVAARIQQAGAAQMTTIPAMLEIERWDAINEMEEMIANMTVAMSGWRVGSSHPIGIYRLMPRGLDTDVESLAAAQTAVPEDATTIAAVQAHMRARMHTDDYVASKLLRYVDFLCPRAYVRDQTDMTAWKYDVTWKVMEAIRISEGKPVRPVVWFNQASNGANLSEANWIAMLQYVASLPRVDGLLLYSGGTAPTGYTWTDAITALVNGTGDFEDT